MAAIGNHLKMHLARRLRQRARQFYVDILGCKPLEAQPYADLDLYEFENDFVVGLFFVEDEQVLSEQDQLKAAWMEIKTSDPAALERRLRQFGVVQVEFADTSRFYFQAPGGQVFRIAPMDGGL
jgi:catechol 2,3-dioxygenase-like lactoylglutathione lyase family enzyme